MLHAAATLKIIAVIVALGRTEFRDAGDLAQLNVVGLDQLGHAGRGRVKDCASLVVVVRALHTWATPNAGWRGAQQSAGCDRPEEALTRRPQPADPLRPLHA